MFRRIIHEHWHDLVPVIAFILTFAVFIIAFIRALLARKETVAHMAALPLDEPLQVPATEAVEKGPAEKEEDAGCSDTCRRCPGCRRKEGGPSHESDHARPHSHSHLHTSTH